MTPEKLLNALNDIDEKIIREARGENNTVRHFNPRRFTAILAAVIALIALATTAFAAEEIAGWFRNYFAQRTGKDLTQEQIQYIEENEQIIADTLKNDGYTVELKSSLTSGDTTYLTLGITAPTDVALEEMDLQPYEGFQITNDQGQPPFTWGFCVQDDLDGLANTVDVVIEIEPGKWTTEHAWYIQIDALYTCFYDQAYEQELLQTKYAGQSDIMFTNEETMRIYQYSVLAEGPWTFTVNVDGSTAESIELLAEPVTVQACVRRIGSEDITSDDYFIDTVEDVTITSFVLTALDASVYYECDGTVRFADFNGECVYAVMKDGTQIQLNAGNGHSKGMDKLLAESPIILDEVAYVLLPDGTKLMMP